MSETHFVHRQLQSKLDQRGEKSLRYLGDGISYVVAYDLDMLLGLIKNLEKSRIRFSGNLLEDKEERSSKSSWGNDLNFDVSSTSDGKMCV